MLKEKHFSNSGTHKIMMWKIKLFIPQHKNNLIMDTVSSAEYMPLPKKSRPMSKEREVSFSSNGGNPQVST